MTPCSAKYKVGVFLLFMAAYWVFYMYPNMFATWPPHLLPLLRIDRETPFLPWTFFIYTSDYTIFLFVIALHQNKESFHSMARMCFATLVICGTFFVLYPTTYPRPSYPVEASALERLLMDVVWTADSPRNCFPSMHVALTGVATWSLRNHSKKVFGFFLVWSLLIFASTLTTKQHYFVDIVGGVTVMAMVAFLEKHVLQHICFRQPKPLL